MGNKLRRARLYAPGAFAIIAAVTLAPQWTHAKSLYQESRGYLGPSVARLASKVPPPPQGRVAIEADERAFKRTRALEGSWRWNQARLDEDLSPKSLLEAFSCASGVELSRERAPHLTAVLTAAGRDASFIVSRAKATFPRMRPYGLYGGPTCLPSQKLGVERDKFGDSTGIISEI